MFAVFSRGLDDDDDADGDDDDDDEKKFSVVPFF